MRVWGRHRKETRSPEFYVSRARQDGVRLVSITRDDDPVSNIIPLALVNSKAKEHAQKRPLGRDVVLWRMVLRHGR
jgi:DNA-binding MurR/RpiR family transcriptional regulator